MPTGYFAPDNTGFTLDNLSFSRLDRNMSIQKQTTDVNLNDSVLRKIIQSTPGTQVSLSQYQGKTKFWQFYSQQYYERDPGSGTGNAGTAGFNISSHFPNIQAGELIQVILSCSNFDDSLVASWCPDYQRVHKFNIVYGTSITSDVYFKGANEMSFVGGISGTTLTVTSIPAGSPGVLPGVYFNNAASGTRVVEQLSGTAFGIGTYSVSVSQTVAAGTTFSDDGGQPGQSWTTGSSGILGGPYFNFRASSQSSGKYNNVQVSYDGTDYVQFDSYNSGNSTSSPVGLIDLLRIEYCPTRPVNSFGFPELGYVPLADYVSATYRAAFPISNA